MTTLGLPKRSQAIVQDMRLTAPGRSVGKNAFLNMSGNFISFKNGPAADLPFESTVELLFAYSLELSPNVLAYVTQPCCKYVARTSASGRKVVSSLHGDFLVFGNDFIKLVETKTIEQFRKLVLDRPNEWREANAVIERPALQEWASALGITYENWFPPEPFGTLLQNFELLNSFLCSEIPLDQHRAFLKIAGHVSRSPDSIEGIISRNSDISPKDVCRALAFGLIHGPVSSCPISETNRFIVFPDQARAQAFDLQAMARVSDALRPVEISRPSLLASSVDLRMGEARRDRVLQMISGNTPETKRYRPLIKRVVEAIEAGNDPLEVCITRTRERGNRDARLSVTQSRAIQHVIDKYWMTGKTTEKKQVHIRVARICKRLRQPSPAYDTVWKRISTIRPEAFALNHGGRRNYNAIRSPSDPRTRTLKPIASGLCICFDSSKFDNRSAASICGQLIFAPPTLYVALDVSNGNPVGHALVFGHARTDALAVLFRDIVHRQGVLPRRIVRDRGPENTSRWLESFCKGSITSVVTATANARANSLAENVIGRVNKQLAHQLAGSTLPDQAGRKVDSRFKSYANARMQFTQIAEQVELFLYEDISRTPVGDGFSPNELGQHSNELFGARGFSQHLDDDFIIRTSIPIKPREVDYQKGVRIVEGTYSSTRLFESVLREAPTEFLLDCVDPTRMYVKFSFGYVTAFHQCAQVFARQSALDRYFHLLYAPSLRSDARREKFEISMSRQSRIDKAHAAIPATAHLLPEQATIDQQSDDPFGAFLPVGDLVSFGVEGNR